MGYLLPLSSKLPGIIKENGHRQSIQRLSQGLLKQTLFDSIFKPLDQASHAILIGK
jgi:hypothetical protein